MREQAKLLFNTVCTVQLHLDTVTQSVIMPKSIETWRSREGKEKYAVLFYQFVSGVFGISDKFEARSLKILFSVRA